MLETGLNKAGERALPVARTLRILVNLLVEGVPVSEIPAATASRFNWKPASESISAYAAEMGVAPALVLQALGLLEQDAKVLPIGSSGEVQAKAAITTAKKATEEKKNAVKAA